MKTFLPFLFLLASASGQAPISSPEIFPPSTPTIARQLMMAELSVRVSEVSLINAERLLMFEEACAAAFPENAEEPRRVERIKKIILMLKEQIGIEQEYFERIKKCQVEQQAMFGAASKP